jgi:hypothetical protein
MQDYKNTIPTKFTSSLQGAILRLTLIFIVFLSVLLWPETSGVMSIGSALLFSLILVCVVNTNFCRVFICTFSTAVVIAFLVFEMLNPLGLFSSALQDSVATDSQFFLYESRRFLDEGDPTALFSTWGSLVPVAYGSFAIMIFGGSYIGVIFLNSLIYTVTVFVAARLINANEYSYRFFPLLGFMPLQCFYNSMLAKEPIYLFLIVSALYFFIQINTSRNTFKVLAMQSCAFFFLFLILVIFRPVGAVVFCVVGLIFIIKEKGFAKSCVFLASIFLIIISSVLVSSYIDYSIPLFFMGEDGGVDFSMHGDSALQRVDNHMSMIPVFMVPLLSPPLSIFAIPILVPIWMISPLPFFGMLMNPLYDLISGRLNFTDFAIFVRFFDGIVILIIILKLMRKKIQIIGSKNPLILFTIFQILTTVVLQFFESGRHRYLPGFVLALLLISSFNRINKFQMSKSYDSK